MVRLTPLHLFSLPKRGRQREGEDNRERGGGGERAGKGAEEEGWTGLAVVNIRG